ncbi:Cthe_2314 family HEPN domain-containing protein [Hymenobacter rigui]|uniref:Uncharacterized protein n=1 Tax=Hymenobacter rigui TaxID=334424 RepID=A0A3R9Q075_9BACT|nr:Cthe_2314 family HEPN domain-containing protein [Hymenobacter rigui]RSK50120.1 hypothetical protein EI291_05565 [Hymenobacter rigui]
MEDLELIRTWHRRIQAIYAQEFLTSIRGIDDEQRYQHNNVNLYERYYQVTSQSRNKREGDSFNREYIIDDLTYLSDQVLYFTAEVYLYAPYINNPLEHGIQPPGYSRVLYPNYQNLPAKRFDMSAETAFEKLYGYWNRLANLINYFLPTPIAEKKVSFSVVVDALEQQTSYQDNEGLKWLVAFKKNEYKKFLDKRNPVVHHLTTATAFRFNHLNARDKETLELLMQKRFSTPNFLKQNLQLSIESFVHTLNLLEEINQVDHTD